MKKGLTEIVIVLDRSGSMASTASDAEGGLREFINTQRKVEGEAYITFYRFDNEIERVFDERPIRLVEDRDLRLSPRGSTALLDAMGRAIHEVGDRLARRAEWSRPEKVYIVVITDGYENASREFTAQRINELITQQRDKYSWEFVFIGANQDAITSAAAIGIAPQYSLTFNQSHKGYLNTYAALSSNITRGRTTGQAVNFSAEQRQSAMETDDDTANSSISSGA